MFEGVLTALVTDRQGRTYLLRIRPYKSIENRIDGAVLALFDVDGGAGTGSPTNASQNH